MMTETAIQEISRETGENMTAIRARMAAIEAPSTPAMRRIQERRRQAMSKVEEIDQDADELADLETRVIRDLENQIKGVESDIGNTESLLGEAHNFVTGFSQGFHTWLDVGRYSPAGLAGCLDNGFAHRRNMLDRIEFLTPDLERQKTALEALRVKLAKAKTALK